MERTPPPAETVVYLSGPMSGHDDHNFPAFDLYARSLRRRGYRVLNPADFGANPKYSWAECLHRDLMVLGYADVVALLPGWENSAGASLEKHVALALGKKVVGVKELL